MAPTASPSMLTATSTWRTSFDKNGFQIERIPAPEDADIFVDNLCIHNGYLYICEFGSSNIYRIAVTAETGEK